MLGARARGLLFRGGPAKTGEYINFEAMQVVVQHRFRCRDRDLAADAR